MQVYGRRRVKNDNNRPAPLWAYVKWPKIELTLNDWGALASKRVQALKYLEERVALNKPLDSEAVEQLKKWNMYKSNKSEVVSHFFVRLGYCSTKEKRSWLVQSEMRLFQLRWKDAPPSDRRAILKDLKADRDYQQIDKEQAIQLGLSGKYPLPTLSNEYTGPSEDKIFPLQKVRFELVSTLVGHMDVYIEDGFAYVPDEHFKSFVTGRFRAHLSSALSIAYKKFTQRRSPLCPRLTPIIKSMEKLTQGPVYQANDSDSLRPKDIKAARNLFPPCMRILERQIRADSHLKHMGRLTYGKFLKGCGMTCDDQIAYYRAHFTKKISAEKFIKDYRYGIRHHYGLEGKKELRPRELH